MTGEVKRIREILEETICCAFDDVAEAEVDCHFKCFGIKKSVAISYRDELSTILDRWGEWVDDDRIPPLKQGPSYIHVGGVLDSQEAALALFALGEVLGFWKVIIPEHLGATPEQAREMAGSGFVMVSGYNPSSGAA